MAETNDSTAVAVDQNTETAQTEPKETARFVRQNTIDALKGRTLESWPENIQDEELYNKLKANGEELSKLEAKNAAVQARYEQMLNRRQEQEQASNQIDERTRPITERVPPYGVMQIDDKPVTSIRFERSNIDGAEQINLSFHMANKVVAKLKALDAETLLDAVGDQNAKAIISHIQVKGSLKGEELINAYGISPEEKSRRFERNVVELVPEKELELIDITEAKARAAQNRQREQILRREQNRVGSRDEDKSIEEPSKDQSGQGNAGDITDRTNLTRDAYQKPSEQDKSRQIEILEQVHAQFRVADGKFHFKDQPGKVAFKDNGERMVTASNDERVAKAMATMADAKGWQTIKVSGHPEFQRAVWLEAASRGIEVRGFKPTEQDLKTLEERREHAMQNSVTKVTTHQGRDQTSLHSDRDHQPPIQQENAENIQTATSVAQANSATQRPEKPALRAYEGRVIEHGPANYNFDPEEKLNYFVKLQTVAGEKIVWGADLSRAINEGKIQTGDDIKLEFKGKQPVTVETLVRDDNGKVIDKKPIDTHRNTWEAQKSDQSKVVEAVAAAYIDAKIKNPDNREMLKAAIGAQLMQREASGQVPTVPMYDKNATPSVQQERTRPQVEHNADRTR